MKKQVLDIKGKVVKEIILNSEIWNIKPHEQSMYDVVVSQLAAQRQGTHKVKNRSEVSGGGIKPWKQKGTGKARQGSIRSPQWRGGGIVFGPTTESNYLKKVNKKVKKLAIKSSLSQITKNNNLIIIDSISLDKPSTKEMIKIISNLQVEGKKVLFVTNGIIENVYKSISNIQKVKNISNTLINVFDLLNANKLIITEAAIKRLEEVYA